MEGGILSHIVYSNDNEKMKITIRMSRKPRKSSIANLPFPQVKGRVHLTERVKELKSTSGKSNMSREYY